MCALLLGVTGSLFVLYLHLTSCGDCTYEKLILETASESFPGVVMLGCVRVSICGT